MRDVTDVLYSPTTGDHTERIAKFERDRVYLKAYLDENQLSSAARGAALFLRALAGHAINVEYGSLHKKKDLALARESISDLEEGIALGEIDYTGWQTRYSFFFFNAAEIYKYEMEDEKTAFAYLQKCAALGHAGCLSIIADAYANGTYGQQKDLAKAVGHHKLIVDTGTEYMCAGAWSANTIANFIYFDGLVTDEGNELYWARKARELQQRLVTQIKHPHACNPLDLAIDEQLFKLAAGRASVYELRNEYGSLVGTSPEPHMKTLARLMTGEIRQAEFDQEVAAIPSASDRCYCLFGAAWFFLLADDNLAAGKYRDLLKGESANSPSCEKKIMRLTKVHRISAK